MKKYKVTFNKNIKVKVEKFDYYAQNSYTYETVEFSKDESYIGRICEEDKKYLYIIFDHLKASNMTGLGIPVYFDCRIPKNCIFLEDLEELEKLEI